MFGRFRAGWLVVVMFATFPGTSNAAHLAMGFRVGEVTHDSAIVWTRVTKNAERNWNGVREPKKQEPRRDEYVPSKIVVSDRQGAVPGAAGQVRVIYAANRRLDKSAFTDAKATDWVTVEARNDFIHQFQLKGLQPGTKYFLKVESRDSAHAPVTVRQTGSFGTPALKDRWQDVSFAVITGQSYWDMDHRQGFHIYPAMQAMGLDFLVPTGDSVYLDGESPLARTVGLARFHWQRMYSLPRHIEFHRSVPGYWEKDDHDAWSNDCWPTLEVKWINPITFAQGLAVFREQVPMGKLTYRTVRWGQGLQIWMVEGRDFRSPNTMPDGPRKTIWGQEQLAWLKRTILESNADFRVLISPTPIVGPDQITKADNHANKAFAYEGNHFRNWTREHKLKNFYVCCGDRHWQYLSIDPKTKLHEFSCGPASDVHAGGSPGHNPQVQPFHRQKGGFLSISVTREPQVPTIAFRHHDVFGKVVFEFKSPSR